DWLAGEVDVGPVAEDGGDLREPVAGERTSRFEIGDTGQGGLDHEGYLLLHFHRRQRGIERVDLHLHVGDVGDGVDGQTDQAIGADRGERENGKHHGAAVLHRPGEGVCAPRGVSPWRAPLRSRVWTRWEPVAAKRSPGCKPAVTSAVVNPTRPSFTGRGRKTSPSTTKTIVSSPSRCRAVVGTATAASTGSSTWAVTNMPGRQRRSLFANTARAVAVRVVSSRI